MSSSTSIAGGQERQNKKLLEQLDEHKKRLKTQIANQPLTKESSSSTHPSIPQSLTPSSDNYMTQSQRTAIQHAHANSVGYFTTQDSAFGNLILPVLPRFDK